MNSLKKTESGFAQLVVLGVMALMAVALPLTTNLVKKNQENRSKAAENNNIPATGITLDLENPVYLSVGETVMMKYHLIPSNSTDKVVWSVTKGSDVVAVDDDGLVKALKPGEANVLGLTSTNRQFGVQDVVVTDKGAGKVNIFYNFREDSDYRILVPGMDIVSELRINTFGQLLSSAEIAYFHTDALEPYLNGVTGTEVTKVVSHKKDGNWNSLKVEFDKSKKPTDSVYILKIKTKIVKSISNAHLEIYKGISMIGTNGEMKTEILNTNGNRMNIDQTDGTNFVIGEATAPSLSPTMTPVPSKPYLFLKTNKNTYSVGETFTVTAGVNSTTNKISGVDGVVNYKTDVLSLISVKKSPNFVFKNSDDDCVINKNFTNGKAIFTCFVGDSANEKIIEGDLVTLTFAVNHSGVSDIAFECNPGEISESNIVVDSKDMIDCSRNINQKISTNNGAVSNSPKCGLSGTYKTTPSRDSLCEVGTPTSVLMNRTTMVYTWKCVLGSETKSCSVRPENGGMGVGTLKISSTPVSSDVVNGKCGESRNTCASGMANDNALPDTTNDYKWKCLGSSGGKNVDCSLSKKISGKCGSKRNTCISGSVSVMAEMSTLYRWRCVGKYGGETVNCSVRK